jgi:hypothetical protein
MLYRKRIVMAQPNVLEGLKIDFGQLFSIAPESGRDATD